MIEDKQPWLNHMSLATVILAVCATLSTFKASSYSTQGVISQSLASDQWAFYQSKSMKQHLHELQVEQLRLQLMSLPQQGQVNSAYSAKIAAYETEIGRYAKEKQEIGQRARAYESQRDLAKQRGKPFGVGVIFLQIAILLNSVAGLLKSRRTWLLGLPLGLIGAGLFAVGLSASW